MVNKVMKLNTRNQICQVEGLVYGGAAGVALAAHVGVCPLPSRLWGGVSSCLCGETR